MKTRLKKRFILRALMACCGLALAERVAGQTFTVLHSFGEDGTVAGVLGGGLPQTGLILSGNKLYGSAYGGKSFATGDVGWGTVFALNTDGTGYTNLQEDLSPHLAGLFLSGNTLYGTEQPARGSWARWAGAVFSVNTNGTGLTNLHDFSGGSDGTDPAAGVILSSNILYGTTADGGASNSGAVFALNTDGAGFTNLYSFTGGSDGDGPVARLVLSGNTLYGTAAGGGSFGDGTVFAVKTDGSGFTNLHRFMGSDGAEPIAGLILSGNTLYGTTENGGSSSNGTVFAIGTDGSGFTNLHCFSALVDGGYELSTNGDGSNPTGGLVLSGNTLYGTTQSGGSFGDGAVFAVHTDGTSFTTLYSFNRGGGADPYAGLILAGNTLYGTAEGGGQFRGGTVFSLTLPAPQLTITASGTNVTMTWPTNYAGFDDTGYTLEFTANLGSPTVWTTNSPAPAVRNGQFVVTIPITNVQQGFYRLR